MAGCWAGWIGAEPPPPQHDFFGGAGAGVGVVFDWQQLEVPFEVAGRELGAEASAAAASTSFCSGSKRGVELALEGFDVSLLSLARVRKDDESVSSSWAALMYLSSFAGMMADDTDFRLRDFCTRPELFWSTGRSLSDGQAQPEFLGME